MFKNTSIILFVGYLSLAFISSNAVAQTCQLDNVFLQAMPESSVNITNSADEIIHLEVKAALNNNTRAAGFQRVCESTIEAKPILFLFDSQVIPSFHMRNVVAPIDIAFIDAQGKIESIHAMKPYVLGSNIQPLYSPNRVVIAALEVHQGFYSKHNIEVGDHIEWQQLQ